MKSLRVSLLASLSLLLATACGGPSVPHAVTSTSDDSCLSCHGTGSNGAPKTPHPDREGCTGCHETAK